MTQEMSTWELVAGVWFCCAVLAEVSCHAAFILWLRRRRVSLSFLMIGVPGYLEHRYEVWCRENNQTSRKWIVVRRLLLANMIVAFVVTFPILFGDL